ncbi:uridylate-specific endoribonuclease A [Boleophthalmus pectinirostris]|uniref:uridylate-specific endoribonuclease A n=1 Tax=Boleophthalmus pectinirostris TaxID=150288 RepID=UPI00242E2DE7|nr:uridylate-specific endoribonuclease A [Boleophthalmus pectinirostris]
MCHKLQFSRSFSTPQPVSVLFPAHCFIIPRSPRFTAASRERNTRSTGVFKCRSVTAAQSRLDPAPSGSARITDTAVPRAQQQLEDEQHRARGSRAFPSRAHDSCMGRCDDDMNSDFTCQCNTACKRFGDCCFDYNEVCKSSFSCKSRCGEAYNSQNECHCNSKCSQYDNCCSDYNDVCGASGSSVTDAEIKSVSEALYALDSNKASGSQLIIDPQTLISNSETGAQTDHASSSLFRYVDEGALFSRPTYAALLALLDNYRRMTGQTESFTQQQLQEQDHFVRETMSNTAVGRELFSFLHSKGIYSSEEEFIEDLKNMWFGLYSRSSGAKDSCGFEHIFAGEVKKGKVSGFHNWIQFYLLEKEGQLNYYSHSFDGPWLSYPDVLGMQFNWDGYYKQVGSAIIGCSPEFDFAIYSLCYITRPGKICYLSLGGKEVQIQTYAWDNSSYGNGKKYIASAYPA